MKIDLFKQIIIRYLDYMLNKFFDSNNFKDMFAKSICKTLIKANINKYDNYLNYITDENNNILIDEMLNNLIDNFEGWQIDLDTLNIPMLPSKILLISKQDLSDLKQMLNNCNV